VNSAPHLRDLHMIQLCQHCWEIALVQVWTLGLVSKHFNTIFVPVYLLPPCCFYIFILQKPISTIHTTLVLPSLRWTSAPIQLTIVLGVLGTQEISCIDCRVAWERPSSTYASHGLINLRSSTWGKICYCPTKPCAWGPNKGLQEERLRSWHQAVFWRRCRGV
jgi:hypothetical protein